VATAAVGWLVRGWRRAAASPEGWGWASAAGPGTDVAPLAVVPGPGEGPVTGLSTAALGQEWLRTTAALAGRLGATARRSIVDRREATLDELERRDPVGFARWMAGGPAPGSDPAEYVQDGPVAGTEAA
jgi:hypothetical protein